MATTPVLLQKSWVPLGQFTGPDGEPVSVTITEEWRRPLDQMAALVNSLKARIDAAGIP